KTPQRSARYTLSLHDALPISMTKLPTRRIAGPQTEARRLHPRSQTTTLEPWPSSSSLRITFSLRRERVSASRLQALVGPTRRIGSDFETHLLSTSEPCLLHPRDR